MKKSSQKTTFILVHYHAPVITLRAIRSIYIQSGPHPIILVDNGSTEFELSTLRGGIEFHKLNVKILTGGGNIGYAGALNLAAKHIKSGYIAIVNNDAELERGWLPRLIAALEKDPSIGLVGGIEIDGEKLHYPSLLNIGTLTTAPRKASQRTLDVEFVSGSNMLLRAKDFHNWCASYFLYYEDIDACLDLWRRGKRVQLVPAARVKHEPNTTTSQIPIKRWVYVTRNRYRLGYHYLTAAELKLLWWRGIKGDVLGPAMRILRMLTLKLIARQRVAGTSFRGLVFNEVGRFFGYFSALSHVGELRKERAKFYDSAFSLGELLEGLQR
jgi:GT2 family glycosyltransferase